MTDIERDRYKRNVEKNAIYQDLLVDERFKRWKEDQIDKRKQGLLDNLKNFSMNTAEGQELNTLNTIRYQLLVEIDDSFVLTEAAAVKAKEKLERNV